MIALMLATAFAFTPQVRDNFARPITLEISAIDTYEPCVQIEVRGMRVDVVRFMERFQGEILPGWREVLSEEQVYATIESWGTQVPIIGFHDDETIQVFGRHLRRWHEPIIWRRAPVVEVLVPPSPEE